jgi:hypothetical protein
MHAVLALLLAVVGWFLPAHADTTGILKVRSNVEAAEVWVDGALLGKAPLTKYIAVGSHQVRVVADNYDPFVRKVDVSADKTVEIQAQLTPGPGTVELVGPPGARLSLDGVDKGALPLRLPAPSSGKHEWSVTAPKFEAGTGSFEYTPGKNLLITVELTPSRGIWVVESTPAGATVVLDGHEVGKTPLRLTDIEPGPHAVLVDGGANGLVVRNVDTTDGSRGEVKVSLPKNGATLEVNTGHAEGEVRIDGVLVGSGAKVAIGPIEKGRVKMEIRGSGQSVSDTVSIPSRGTLHLHAVGDEITEQKPLVQRWGFWAVVGGAAVAGGVTTAAVVNGLQPADAPVGDSVVSLP